MPSIAIYDPSWFGREVALEAKERGFSPIWLISDTQATLDESVLALGGGLDVRPILADPGRPSDVAALESVWQRSAPDIFAACGGSRYIASLMDTSDEQWESVLSTNLTSVFRLVRAVSRAMIADQRAGVISVIASVVAVTGYGNRAAYTASKAGVVGLVKAAALDLAPHGIRIFAVSPGAFDGGGKSPEELEHNRSAVPLGRNGHPRDVARVIMDLAAVEFLTGTNVVIDGGQSLGPKE